MEGTCNWHRKQYVRVFTRVCDALVLTRFMTRRGNDMALRRAILCWKGRYTDWLDSLSYFLSYM